MENPRLMECKVSIMSFLSSVMALSKIILFSSVSNMLLCSQFFQTSYYTCMLMGIYRVMVLSKTANSKAFSVGLTVYLPDNGH